MSLKLYSTLTKQKEEFIPIAAPDVGMYVCGITPYDETHVGHARAYVTFDIIRRYLKYSGFKVNYVQNITDIDDKIINKSLATGRSCQEIASQYTQSYFEMMEKLNVQEPSISPKATEHIKDMINTIEILMQKGFAYEVNGDVFFEVRKFHGYGKLSNRKLEDNEAGARVVIDKRKKGPEDFSLWKSAKPNEPSWDSPWGKGRPSWHIECSTMSTKYLGDTFDMHGGGMDLIFPHHENEIAQAEAATGKPFAKYFIHNGFITVNQEKMSKSLGNFFTLKEVFEKFDPMAVRLFLLSTHYRSPINFSDEQLKASQEALNGIINAIADSEFVVKRLGSNADLSKEIKIATGKFEQSMDDDFNTASALAAIFDLVKLANHEIAKKQMDENLPDKIRTLLKLLGIEIKDKNDTIDNEVKKLIQGREDARRKKDFKKADEIRDLLKSKGITIEDTIFGTKWSKNA